MASGDTFVTSVDAGLPTMVAAARRRNQFPTDVMQRVVDRQSLPPGTGTSYREFLAENLTAQNYGETDDIENPQEITGSILSATPQLVAIMTFIGDRVPLRLDRKAFAQFGELGQEAMERKGDTDGHAMFASATTTVGATATTLSYSNADWAVQRIRSDATEPGKEPIAIVLHGYGIHDIRNELIAGVSTYPVPNGYSEEVFKNGFRGSINGANVYHDGLIAVDSTPDARGGVFAKRGILMVVGKPPWTATQNMPGKGYGGKRVWLKSEYVFAERSSGNWLY